ncbi:MAG TPA: hypothetical protein DIC27_05775 [Hydrogenobaculum sp.]|nr:hypothetical protein [Hydrogenobaculum sp.]
MWHVATNNQASHHLQAQNNQQLQLLLRHHLRLQLLHLQPQPHLLHQLKYVLVPALNKYVLAHLL